MAETSLLDDPPVLRRRGSRNVVDPTRPYAFFVEPEYTAAGVVEDVATIFITNRECPFRCVFCDLWKNTTEQRVPSGAVAGQVEWALRQLPFAPHMKLYNSGNFFDEQAVPRADRPRIAELVKDRKTVIVECHPKLVDRRCLEFADQLRPQLQVAMGLETIDPRVLPRLDKGMTLEDFERATSFLSRRGIPVRAFILLPAPFQTLDEGTAWAKRSIEHAFSIGVECCSIVPLRSENNAKMHRPDLRAMEAVHEFGLSLARGRVFVDLWDAELLAGCGLCRARRIERLAEMNRTQRVSPAVRCECGA